MRFYLETIVRCKVRLRRIIVLGTKACKWTLGIGRVCDWSCAEFDTFCWASWLLVSYSNWAVLYLSCVLSGITSASTTVTFYLHIRLQPIQYSIIIFNASHSNGWSIHVVVVVVLVLLHHGSWMRLGTCSWSRTHTFRTIGLTDSWGGTILLLKAALYLNRRLVSIISHASTGTVVALSPLLGCIQGCLFRTGAAHHWPSLSGSVVDNHLYVVIYSLALSIAWSRSHQALIMRASMLHGLHWLFSWEGPLLRYSTAILKRSWSLVIQGLYMLVWVLSV